MYVIDIEWHCQVSFNMLLIVHPNNTMLMIECLFTAAVTISFETPIIKQVQETAGSIPVKLKSKGLYSRAFEISFTCVELDPVEAKGYLFMKTCSFLPCVFLSLDYDAHLQYV